MSISSTPEPAACCFYHSVFPKGYTTHITPHRCSFHHFGRRLEEIRNSDADDDYFQAVEKVMIEHLRLYYNGLLMEYDAAVYTKRFLKASYSDTEQYECLAAVRVRERELEKVIDDLEYWYFYELELEL